MAKSSAPTMIEFVLEGKIQWPSLWKLDKYNKYSFILSNLDETNVAIAENANLRVRTDKPEWGSYVSLQRKELNFKNGPNGEIIVTDNDKRAWDKSVGIGNGSLAKAKGVSIEYDKEEGKWTNKTERVKILELVEYKLAEASDEWDVIGEPVAEGTDEFGDTLPNNMQAPSETSGGETSEKDFD